MRRAGKTNFPGRIRPAGRSLITLIGSVPGHDWLVLALVGLLLLHVSQPLFKLGP